MNLPMKMLHICAFSYAVKQSVLPAPCIHM